VHLDGVTATETNNFGFEVEKKVPGNNWQKIGFVQGNGTTIEAQHYNFVDFDLANGDYQFRLKQIDTDGSFEYSSILSVSVGGPATTRLEQNSPNPFNPTTNVIYSIQKEGFVQLEIYDLLGRTVKSLLSEIKSAGEYSLSWDGKNDQGELVASGIYYYTLKVENETLYSKRMILMK
ncbi:T9SS type A sorting domain-containing protein, partial [candidate division KSB1 bacterium]|nr:T9SS type A sorting domain-containing protein [candidate division KSB1 bacterium]